MKKILFIITALTLSLGLIACSEEKVEEKPVENVDLNDADVDVEETDDVKEEENETEEVKEFAQEVVDNDSITAHLVKVEKIVEPDWDEEKYEITFEVENKRDSTIEVQAREVSADGKMIDESMIMMSQEISSGKFADAVLTIQNFDGDLPEIEEELELFLHVFDYDDFEFELDVDVKIEF